MYAAEKGHADCARLLLNAGAYKNATDEVRASAGCGMWTRLGVRDDTDVGMWCEETCHLHFSFHFLFRTLDDLDFSRFVRRIASLRW